MTALSVRGLTVLRDGRPVLRDTGLSAESSSLTCLLGLAGAGKTSLLAAIAGLLPIGQGAVLIGGADVTRLTPRRRGVGFLAPGTSLAEGRTVRGALSRLAGAGGAARAAVLIDALGLAGVAGQGAGLLSHGQAALALAAARLLPPGGVLLVDEAGAGLDDPSRVAFISILRDLAAAGRTVLMATRCPRLAQAADHLVLLSDGRVLQAGPPALLYARPGCAAAARLTGPANILGGIVREKRPGGFIWAASGRYVQATSPDAPAPKLGSAVALCLRPEHLMLLPEGAVADNSIEGRVQTVEPGPGTCSLGVHTPLGLLHTIVPAYKGPEVCLGWAASAPWVMSADE